MDNIQNKNLFIGLSILLRIIEAVGHASTVVAGFSLLGTVFPNGVVTSFVSVYNLDY